MPTYEYACPTCGIVEVFQPITESALTKCPRCRKAKVTRMISGGGGVIFKGSGFWETDYRQQDPGSDYQQKAKSESTPAAGADQNAAKSDGDKAGTTSADAASTKDAGKKKTDALPPAPKAQPEPKPAAAAKPAVAAKPAPTRGKRS